MSHEPDPSPATLVTSETVPRRLACATQKFAHREFLRCEDRSLTFAQTYAETAVLARALGRRGIDRGDRVAIMLPNDSRWPLCWLAALRAGAISVPVNHSYQQDDLEYVLRDSGAAVVVANDEAIERVRRTPAGRSGDVQLRTPDDLAAEAPTNAETLAGDMLEPDDLANLQYTSGTTGFPKACMLTHEHWARMGDLTAQYARLRSDDVALTAQPFSYIDPQWNTLMCMTAGIPLVVLPRFSASGFWASVREHDVSIFYILGTMPTLLYKQPPHPSDRAHRVRLVMCSGIVPDLHAAFEERWGAPWREAYGLTETGVDITVPIDATDFVGSGSIGYPISTKQVRVVDDTGREVADGESGEITIRGTPMMQGYWNQPEKTAEVFMDGWFHTGDLGVRNPDGSFRIVGRLKDMVRRGGENISCAEVESVLDQHPAIVTAAVTPTPDELFGEEVKAFVQLRPEHHASADAALDIVLLALERLAKFKVPRYVEFVDEFPLTPSARISKPELTRTQPVPERTFMIDINQRIAEPLA